VLGSSSPYRRELLARLGLPFEVHSPNVDETPKAHERPAQLAERLALSKARAVAQSLSETHPDPIVIGSDQVADLHGQCLGKPGTHARAIEQLRAMSGQTVLFQTAVAVFRPATGHVGTHLSTVKVVFRPLDDTTIEAYLRREQPYDCAGSAKVEGLGIALLSSVQSDDPTSLIGLPLIALTQLLRQAGLDPLNSVNPLAPHP
jgi:septum formation protein